MIIDSHLHFGSLMGFNMPEKILIESMKKYRIDFGLVSNIGGAEFDHNLKPINNSEDQMSINKKTLELVKKYLSLLRGLFWIKPHSEEYDRKIEHFIRENRELIVGLKIHPYHSNLSIDNKKYIPYIELAEKLNLPVQVHTGADSLSDPKHVHQVSKIFPKVNFILVHMGLKSDNEESIELIKNNLNLYGDTTWVPYHKVVRAVKTCGENKILFGTDNPIDGIDTYDKYKTIIDIDESILSKKEKENLLSENCIRLYQLSVRR